MPFFRAKKRTAARKIAIIGLDCAEPTLIFDRYAADMPTLTRLRSRGVSGRLETVIPAITVPAWSCMASGRDPGALGIYGFRNRRDHSYDGLMIATGAAVRLPRLWDIAAQHGRRSVILNVPGTYPVSPVDGAMIGCFLSPPASTDYTWPPALAGQITDWLGGQPYPFDVKDFRSGDKTRILDQVQAMTRTHFDIARRLVQHEAWDLFMMVEIGLDRIHHAFWAAMDDGHRQHDPADPFREAIRDYHRLLDAEIARLLACFDEDTVVLVVSDHGAKRMDGGLCLNEWLIREGYLVLNETPPSGIHKFEALNVDWSRTRAWGEGGYYGRVFVNVTGREPQGSVLPESIDDLLDELTTKLCGLGDENDQPIGTRCFRPADIYPVVNGVPPDLLVYFGDLAWRAVGTVGWGRVHIEENDTGPDDANHAQHGIFIYADPRYDLGGQSVDGAHILNIAPTVLGAMGLPVPADMQYPPLRLG